MVLLEQCSVWLGRVPGEKQPTSCWVLEPQVAVLDAAVVPWFSQELPSLNCPRLCEIKRQTNKHKARKMSQVAGDSKDMGDAANSRQCSWSILNSQTANCISMKFLSKQLGERLRNHINGNLWVAKWDWKHSRSRSCQHAPSPGAEALCTAAGLDASRGVSTDEGRGAAEGNLAAPGGGGLRICLLRGGAELSLWGSLSSSTCKIRIVQGNAPKNFVSDVQTERILPLRNQLTQYSSTKHANGFSILSLPSWAVEEPVLLTLS